MLGALRNYLLDLRDRQQIAIALTRGTAMMNARRIDLTLPSTWEFSGFSQNGEDGILDVLRRQLGSSNRYFVEIGAGSGIENNTTWLALAEKHSGVMIEGDERRAARAARMLSAANLGVECRHLFVVPEIADQIVSLALQRDPDVLSVDIDGCDYYVVRALLEAGLRPRILAVEYNSVFGAERSATIEYSERFDFTSAHPTQLYYGVSIAGWRTYLEKQDYRFVTVERNGVNAFFVDPVHFDPVFLRDVKGLGFAENYYQLRKFRAPNAQQFSLIASQAFVSI
jgi:predicted O-methyltransferase YrrM